MYWLIRPRRLRGLFLVASGFAFVSGLNAAYALVFLLMSVMVWGAGMFFSSGPAILKKRLVFISLLVLLWGELFLYKAFAPAASLSGVDAAFPAGILFGFSYLTFRLTHYLIESFRGTLSACSCADFLLYVFFFPIFPAGPLERFSGFHAQTVEMGGAPEVRELNYGLVRILLGIIKKIILADPLQRMVVPVLAQPADHTRFALMLALYGAAVQIYMDFSGYCDIAIGSARLFGYRITENFNVPFLKNNLASFWRSWHITLYTWIRDYFFFPVFGWRASRIKIYAGIFFSMMLFTVWHRINVNFLLLGVYNGLGLMGWYFFQDVKRVFPAAGRVASLPGLAPLGCAATITFFSFGLVFFRDNYGETAALVKRLLFL